jgi:hypothetical protein
MAAVIDAINHQIEYSIYKNESKDAKVQLASTCETIKRAAIIVIAIAVPFFSACLPNVFRLACCFGIGVVSYDIFNMANNLGNAAKFSAKGVDPGNASNVEMLVDSTLLAKALYNIYAEVKESQTDQKDPALPIDDLSEFDLSEA